MIALQNGPEVVTQTLLKESRNLKPQSKDTQNINYNSKSVSYENNSFFLFNAFLTYRQWVRYFVSYNFLHLCT